MSRAQRLLDLIQDLRSYRRPVAGATLADGLGISLRTLYRDIETLKAQGAQIDGEPGVGFVLKPGFMLPPLMFSEDEIEAIVLGSRWVAKRTDAPLGEAARSALAKIAAVLPPDLKEGLDAANLLVGPGQPLPAGVARLSEIREAIRRERKLIITYADNKGETTERVVWPFALAFFDAARLVATWCEMRQDYRSFRTDRITALAITETRYPKRRQALLKAFRERENIPEQ